MGNSAVRTPQAEGPWQRAARLGSSHSEPTRLTVGNLLTRSVQRVNRPTPKKAVMVIYRRAGCGRAPVDTRATAAWHGSGYSRQGMTGNGVVSAVPLFRCDSSTAESTGLSIQEMPVRIRFAAPVSRITPPSGGARRGLRLARPGLGQCAAFSGAGSRSPAWRTHATHRTVCTERLVDTRPPEVLAQLAEQQTRICRSLVRLQHTRPSKASW